MTPTQEEERLARLQALAVGMHNCRTASLAQIQGMRAMSKQEMAEAQLKAASGAQNAFLFGECLSAVRQSPMPPKTTWLSRLKAHFAF